MTTTATAQRDGITVEVAPGGALRSLHLDPQALRLGGPWLARAITALVTEANDRASLAAEQAMRSELGDLSADDLAALGLARPATEASGADSVSGQSGLAAGLDAVRGTARGNGVAVSVDLQGLLVDLRIDDQAFGLGPQRLASEISRVSGQACSHSLRQGMQAIEAGCGPEVAAAVGEHVSLEERSPESEPESRSAPVRPAAGRGRRSDDGWDEEDLGSAGTMVQGLSARRDPFGRG